MVPNQGQHPSPRVVLLASKKVSWSGRDASGLVMRPLCHYGGGMASTTLRLPDDLYAKVVQQAQRDRRSVNAQLVWLIEHAVEGGGQ